MCVNPLISDVGLHSSSLARSNERIKACMLLHNVAVHKLPPQTLGTPYALHRHRSSVSFRGQDIYARKMCMKINKMPKFCMILARKISKIPEFLYLPEKLTKFPNFT